MLCRSNPGLLKFSNRPRQARAVHSITTLQHIQPYLCNGAAKKAPKAQLQALRKGPV